QSEGEKQTTYPPVVAANAGTHPPRPPEWAHWRTALVRHASSIDHAVWVPAFAGTTVAAYAGTVRAIRRCSSSRLCCLTKLTAKPFGKCLMTRPMQAPIASGVPVGGWISESTATPDIEPSMMGHAQ